MTEVSIALELAERGLPVFPCGADKRPCIPKNEGGNGFHDATTDPDKIRRLFDRPGVRLIGVPTGERSGLDALDIDLRHGGERWEAENRHHLPETRVHETMSGGRHWVFRHAPGVRNSAGKIAPGVDVRGQGGYIIMPPSAGYSIVSDVEPAEWPDWLLELILSRPEPKREMLLTLSGGTDSIRDRALDRVRAAGEGQKHFTLRNQALVLGGIQDQANFGTEEAVGWLLAALPATARDRKLAEKTARWGLAMGARKPLEIVSRPVNGYRHDARHDAIMLPEGDAYRGPDFQSVHAGSGLVAPAGNAVPGDDFLATPLDPDELTDIPARQWVYGRCLIRKFISVLASPGGVGKTAYAVAIALSVAVHRELLEEQVHRTGAAWIYNLEDPREELCRRIAAACAFHEIEPEALRGLFYLDSGRDRPLVIAAALRDGGVVASPIVPAIIEEIRRRSILLLVVDPFVRSHRLEENRNEQIDFAAALWGRVADEGNCAVLLVHHFKKGGQRGDSDAIRGASALVDAARAAVSLAKMSEEEADRVGAKPADRRFLIRADNAKLNLAPPPEEAVLLRLESVDLPNGDTVQTVSRFRASSPYDGLSMAATVASLMAIEKGPSPGEFFTGTRRGRSNDRWCGHVLVEKFGRNAEQAAVIVNQWLKEKLLLSGVYRSPAERRDIACVRVDPKKLGEMRTQIRTTAPSDSGVGDEC